MMLVECAYISGWPNPAVPRYGTTREGCHANHNDQDTSYKQSQMHAAKLDAVFDYRVAMSVIKLGCDFYQKDSSS